MDYREYKDEKTQLVVLTAAQKFLQDGIESVKMTDLADSCGVGVASLYRYFGTKTAIVVAAGTLLWQDVSKLFEGVFEGPAFLEKPGLSRIRELLGIFLTLYRQEPAFLKFLYEFDEFVLREKPDQQLLMRAEKRRLAGASGLACTGRIRRSCALRLQLERFRRSGHFPQGGARIPEGCLFRPEGAGLRLL